MACSIRILGKFADGRCKQVWKLETTAYETSIHVFKHGKCFEVTLPSQLATFYGYYPFLTIDCMLSNREFNMGTQREYSSKPLKHISVKRILLFKR